MQRNKFWMVYCPVKNMPKHEHSCLLSATTEAKRLAYKHPNYTFIILEATKGFIQSYHQHNAHTIPITQV